MIWEWVLASDETEIWSSKSIRRDYTQLFWILFNNPQATRIISYGMFPSAYIYLILRCEVRPIIFSFCLAQFAIVMIKPLDCGALTLNAESRDG